jgi:replicative DNA helicase
MIYLDERSNEQYDLIKSYEEGLLSLLINNDNESVYETLERIKPEDFCYDSHRQIYKVIVDLVLAKNLKVDKYTLRNHLDQPLHADLDTITNLNILEENVLYYINKVRNFSQLTNFTKLLVSARSKLTIDTNIDTESVIGSFEDDLLKIVTHDTKDFSMPKDILPSVMAISRNSNQCGIKTCLPSVDDIIGSLVGYVIIAGRPSLGKSSLALDICRRNAEKNIRSAFFSLEMTKEQLTIKLLAALSGVNSKRIQIGDLTLEEINRIEKAIPKVEDLPIHIDNPCSSTAHKIVTKTKRLKIKHPDLAFIVVDYLQLVTPHVEGSQEHQVGSISNIFKALSLSLNIPVIMLSQLNRLCEARDNKRPMLSDLRHSGEIEQGADIVEFLYRESYYNKTVTNNNTEIITAKNRNGETGTAIMDFDMATSRFLEL